MSPSLMIRTIVSQPFEENSYLVWKEGQREALIFDPGMEPERILEELRNNELTLVGILNTHGHADHIAGNGAMKEAFPTADLIIGQQETNMLSDANANLSAPFGMPFTSPAADRTVVEGDTIELAELTLEVLDVPGHSPGHVVFLYRGSPCIVFGGDVLFRGSIGRYDFPGSNGELLKEGIRTKLFTLPPDTVIYPGHGPVTTVEYEQRSNPFVGAG